MKAWEGRDDPAAKLLQAHSRALGVWQALTPVEQELARHIAKGTQGSALAAAMGWHRRTVETTVARIARKLDLPPCDPGGGGKVARRIAVLVEWVDAA